MKKKILLIAAIACVVSCGTKKTAIKQETPSDEQKTERVTETKTVPETQEPKKKHVPEYMWGDIDYHGDPWVKNMSKAHYATEGLQNRHITLWASHGRYYDQEKGYWKWQRPFLFGTTEDLYTQTIVIPYLIPMLERAGAVVFTPRERDWQRHEVIVDNDHCKAPYYKEVNGQYRWENAKTTGFAWHDSVYQDHENPFEAGTTRKVRTSRLSESIIAYQPDIPQTGSYAVYVSYPTLKESVSNAEYTVYHQGQQTTFHVNQQMGGSTWVYLGTFDFDKGCSPYNCVKLSNKSDQRGVVTADAVRFGGGMGNITRGDTISGMPRCLEGARYYAQWAGAPYEVYSSKNGENDYGDDINVRSYMSNWLGGGSCYMPDTIGKKVPFELSLAIHSDAGVSKDYQSLVGSLAICTTDFHDGKLNSGISREASKLLAGSLLNDVYKDLSKIYRQWTIRDLYDRNYSETRCPEVPSAIFETLSHQNFPDMILGQDPNFRFNLARSIYKCVLRYITKGHGKPYTVAPLAPKNLAVEFTDADRVTLTWDATIDSLEKSAKPTAYIVYKSTGVGGYDNGTLVKDNHYSTSLPSGVVTNFRVSAVNKGGESFPSETISALYHAGATRSIMIVDGFHRLSAPAVRNTATEQGFDFDKDPGVWQGKTAGWSGRQINFNKRGLGIEGPGGLGYCGHEWQGQFFMGNDGDNVYTHAEAMKQLLKYNVVSCSSHAVEQGKVDLSKYHVVDLLLGLEKENPYHTVPYKSLSPLMQQRMTKYAQGGGALLVSGAYLGSDNQAEADTAFIHNILKVRHGGVARSDSDSIFVGMGTTLNIFRVLNESHYAATATDILQPIAPAYCAMTYQDKRSACVAYAGNDYHAFSMGFPFECINSYRKRSAIMKGIINFLVEERGPATP